MSIEQRFFNKVLRTPGCWLWLGSVDTSGYGLFKLNGVAHKATRFVYEATGGYIPPGLQVMHWCDNPRCVRPDHLSLGTCQDNMNDRNAKQRQARGERSGGAVLKTQDVLEIRASEAHPKTLAARFKISLCTIYNIRARRIWRHV